MSALASCGHNLANAYRRLVPIGDLSRCSIIREQSRATRSCGEHQFAERDLWNIRRSLGLDVARADHLSPFFCLVSDELAELGRCHRHRHTTEIIKSGFELRIGESCVYFHVQLVNDVSRRVPGRADTKPHTRLIPRHELAHGWKVGQGFPARRAGDSESTQCAGPDILN